MDTQASIKELSIAHESTQLERIGQGRCGTVWAARCSKCDGHGHLAMKREDGSTGRSISHEYKMHQKLLRASSQSHPSSFAIPESFGFLNSQDSSTWSGILPRLPGNYTACKAIVSEKIIPVRASTRRLLIRKFRPDVDEESAMNSSSNEHCLIRPYLGRRRYRNPETDTEPRKRLRAFSLRNFPLHLDQMEQLGIDPKVQSEDACLNNINILGPHAIWILDFDLCRDLILDESCIEQACNAFWERFLESSAKALATRSNQIKELPRLLMEKIRQAAATTSNDEIGDS
ncbi:hypothetical protein LI328DRAFT_166716 [Trichoderma asperelloides]|nr:hypothetical protein LI328DRAFT_166716 [Trichoderma asperelloides]